MIPSTFIDYATFWRKAEAGHLGAELSLMSKVPIGLSNDISPSNELSIRIGLSADPNFLTALSIPSTPESVASCEVV